MTLANLSRNTVNEAVKTLFAEDVYKPLSAALGGWAPVAQTVWTSLQGLSYLGWGALDAVLRGAFSVATALADVLGDFIADLLDVLAILAEGADDLLAGAANGAATVARIGMGIPAAAITPLISMGQEILTAVRPGAGGLGRIGIAAIVTIAVTVGVVTLGSGAVLVGVAVGAVGGAVGGALGAANSRTGQKARQKLRTSRTARRFGR